jgi:hypothetical protein
MLADKEQIREESIPTSQHDIDRRSELSHKTRGGRRE